MRPRELSRLLSQDFESLVRLLDEWRSVLNPSLRETQFPKFAVSALVTLADVADGDVVFRFRPGFSGRILGLDAYDIDEVTTPGDSASFQVRINDLPTTGGKLFLSSDNFGTKGVAVRGSTVTDRNVFTDSQEITIVATTSAPFAEGVGALMLAFG